MGIKYSDIFPLSVSGGGVYRTLINEATTLTNSGHYYSNSLASDINVNAGSLTSGKQILWFNDSANDVIFSGLTSIGGVAIPENQGVKISPSNYIEFTVDSTGVITKNRGTHTIDWIAGYTPPFQTFTYASPGDTSGIIYYLGATKYNTAFQNPVTRGEVSASASASIDSNRLPPKAIDRGNDGNNGCWHSNHTGIWWQIEFNNNQTARINRFEIWGSTAHSLTSFTGNTNFQAWDGNQWITLINFTPSGETGARWLSPTFTNTEFYSLYRFSFSNPSSSFAVIGDVEFYGDLQS